MNERPFIAVDWGTSSLRGAWLGADGTVIEERAFPRGILSVPAGGFPAVFGECFGDWMRQPQALCLISGMAGSRQGWAEAPYCPCPAGFSELSSHLHWIEPGRIALVPGLSHVDDGTPDVMRGEEVQIFGAMQLAGRQDGMFVLPGTHSKWATVRQGRVTAFRTYMTGEFYALLSEQSILARTLDARAPFDRAAFLRGTAHSQGGGGLLHSAFSARTLSLFGTMAPGELASYLSGLLIGDELRSQALPQAAMVTLIGSPLLVERYAIALQSLGLQSTAPESNATWAGLHALRLQIDTAAPETP